ncbi:MAG: GTP 3',8-cyclase MoaA [Acidimicrobiales bacterium]
MTGRDALTQVLEGIDAALASGLAPVKVNCVLIRGRNDDEILDFAAFGRDRGVEVRFIEWMPLDANQAWTSAQVVPGEEIISTIGSVWPLDPVPVRGNAPAESWVYADGGGKLGVVASVTRSFCSSCDRIRMTAEGQLRNCLFSIRETDMRAVLRGGGSDDDIAAAIEAEVGLKWAGHSIGNVSFVRPARSMSQIGG